MRTTRTNDGLNVHAVAGTYVVLLGFDLPQADCPGLLGFSILRRDHTENEETFLHGQKTFAETATPAPRGTQRSSEQHPIQSFQWEDYTAKPGHRYSYTVTALKGEPRDLQPHARTTVSVETESPEGGIHDVYFNRGVAGSQAYERHFGDLPPDKVPDRAAFTWLSRGLNEALEDFLRSCVPGRHALRFAAYEFSYARFLAVIKEVVDAGVDVKIVYDARSDYTREANSKAVRKAGLAGVSSQRTFPTSYISHNKFIVKLEDGEPIAVWTGSTNFSAGGIYGHSNVAHVVEDPDVAGKFLDYWLVLDQDPASSLLKDRVEEISPLPAGRPPQGTTVLFSPRRDESALDWYAELAMAARQGVFMTFAFGMNDVFKAVYRDSQAPFRLALMEQATRPMRRGPARTAEEERIQQLRNMPQNVFAVGNFIRTNELDAWAIEKLSGLNSHVKYVHNKYMLLDPLSDDPIVVSGSANFSDASVRRNDENMVIVRGNKRVADIYLGEFMRMYTHHAFRESLKWRDRRRRPSFLRTDDWWRDYYGDTPRSTRRRFFARSL